MRHQLPEISPGKYPSPWLRLLILCTALLGINYIVWRWFGSINWAAWWIAVPLVIAETYSVIDSLLFAMTMWKMLRRNPPPPPPDDATVDVFITTYNEPIDMVLETAEAAQRIRFPHSTWILDDGDRHDLAEAAAERGIGYITRSSSWTPDKPRHAKAGNLNNALFETHGEFILVLDADQVPEPEILDRTLGYFRDPHMALVQTPQYFHNVPFSDPLGSQAPLFYGPIQQGKDGWNAAYFCGSNAVLRREALMRLGIRGYVRAVEEGVRRTLYAARKMIRTARKQPGADQPEVQEALESVLQAVRDARRQLRDKRALADITFDFQQRVDAAARTVVDADITAMRADLEVITALSEHPEATATTVVFDDEALESLAGREWSPLGAIESIGAMIRAVDVGRDDEAQPMLPMATISVTEDMATCMRLHALGWRSAYHHEVLARGLAPDDVRTMLTQRLRWAQGTIQVMLRENPFVQKGLSIGQKLMYWATMYSYLAGFAALAYIAAPAIYLIFGIMPVTAYSWDFFGRLIPFLVLNQLMFIIISRGTPTWRGQQYSLALFPVWIRACYTAFLNVVFGRPLGFAVTPKTRQEATAIPWHLVKWQLAAMAMLVVASIIGIVQLYFGAISVLGVGVNLFWVIFDLLILSVVIQAVRFRGHQDEGV
ncbi:glycosyltransferase family 2 protein [Mycolicibacterium monacense]|uniref:Cellulose synthase n=4 Tax=Mycobacteriaceae TaxID=1762 RepID=A0AAD1N1I6_MYCMB|nr:glycosyltransferase [Mycolicibacterium monacense]MDA4101775.1 cellulose synthase [Mycolicibacterium monacense DSM 44395]OBB74450.1 cellulose synthase [Mycolicibacterium monacense]OBF50755.1 cellulose synthase [Mycolicibacterium monacense]ORB12084.1 cellulose synthase [Mycolicibacterium monacense DSM 44395]QHP84252.1 glycosyltransferase [Mycolicibacterium monacense DSM 44395]